MLTLQSMIADYFNRINPRNAMIPSEVGVTEGIAFGTLVGAAKLTGALGGYGFEVKKNPYTNLEQLSALLSSYKAVELIIPAANPQTGDPATHAVAYDGKYMYTYLPPIGYSGPAPTRGQIEMAPSRVLEFMSSKDVIYLSPIKEQ